MLPTDTLRNSTFGNQIKFYIFGSYNNNPTDNNFADGRFAVFSSQMTIDVKCGGEILNVRTTDYIMEYDEGNLLFQN